jgi:predicted DNA binding CopG/RHH family protein
VESAKIELFNRVENPDMVLPPIKHPSLHPRERPFETYLDELQYEKYLDRRKKDLAQRRLKTAEENFKSVAKEYPQSKHMMNIRMASSGLPDPSEKKDAHSAARTFQNTSPM